MATIDYINPRPQQLKQLPTLAIEDRDHNNYAQEFLDDLAANGVQDFRFELKRKTQELRLGLRTHTIEHWLCTKGLPTDNEASKVLGCVLAAYTVDYVTVRILDPEENLELEAWSYGPADARDVQKEDYIAALCDERDELFMRQERQPSWEIAKQIAALQREINELALSQ